MPNGLDLTYKPKYGITGIAQLLAQKPMMEEQIRASQRQGKHQKFNRFLNTISTASQLAQLGGRLRREKLERERQGEMGKLLASAVDTGLAPGAEGPVTPQVARQQQVAEGIPKMSGQSSQIAKAFAFPGMEEQPDPASPLGKLTNFYGTLTNESMLLDPDSPEYVANVKQRNSISKRIAALSGTKFIPIPLPPKKAEVAKEKKKPGLIKRLMGGFGPGEAEAAGPAPQKTPKEYRTAKDVQRAYRNGEISKSESLRLLREKFGYE